MKSRWLVSLVGIVAVGIVAAGMSGKSDEERAVERTRRQVRMLDDIYKTAVVLITKHYVNDDDDLPAGTAAIVLFSEIKKKGWHEVRLLDATGDPLDDENTAKDDFERAALKAMKAGEDWHEAVVKRKGKTFLRVATPLPVVLEKCTMCHDNYKSAKPGQAIGFLSYTVPLVR